MAQMQGRRQQAGNRQTQSNKTDGDNGNPVGCEHAKAGKADKPETDA